MKSCMQIVCEYTMVYEKCLSSAIRKYFCGKKLRGFTEIEILTVIVHLDI